MANDKKKTADEIVDDLAEEMGVKDSKSPESSQSSDDMMAGLDDIFGVGTKKKKKKKKDAPKEEASAKEPEAPAEEVEEDTSEEVAEEEDTKEEEEAEEEAEEEVQPAKKETKAAEPAKKKKKNNAIDGVFATGSGSDDDDDMGISFDTDDSYLDEDDLGDFEPRGGNNKTTIALVAVIVVLGGALLYVLGSKSDPTKGEELSPVQKVVLILKGDYREYKLARKKRIEEEFARKQLEGVERYGNLSIDGNPLYARIKLNGEIQYAPTSNGAYRELRLKPGISNFQDLKVKKTYKIEVSAPGHTPFTFDLTEGKWKGIKKDNPTATGAFNLTAALVPVDTFARDEYAARLGSDTENEFFGSINITSNPPGAKITFNNKPLLNEKGEELVTPATFDKYYVKNEKGKFEEKPVRVDTTMDLGHKIELQPANTALPKYVAQLERQMWTCTKKDEKEIKKLPKEHSIQLECNYSYKLNADFNGVKGYIDRLEAERKAVVEKNKKLKEKLEKLKNKKAGEGVEEFTKKN